MQTHQSTNCQPASAGVSHNTAENAVIYPIATVINRFLEDFIQTHHPNKRVIHTLKNIARCRTGYFGGQQLTCNHCGFTKTVYHSCGDRNCPTCQSIKKELWIDKRKAQLLHVKHFHVIFTIPHQLNELCLSLPGRMYGLLFASAWKAIAFFINEQFGKGAKTGMIASLHTWGSNLSLHPHLHCIIPAGTLSPDGTWKNSPGSGTFLVRGRCLTQRFKRFFRGRLKAVLGRR